MCSVPLICFTVTVIGWILICDGFLVRSQNSTSVASAEVNHAEEARLTSADCEYLDTKDVNFLEDGIVVIFAYNETMPPSRSSIAVGNASVCFNRSKELKEEIFNRCYKMLLEAQDFKILPNSSVLLFKPHLEVMEPGTYKFHEDSLLICDSDELYDFNPFAIYESTIVDNFTTSGIVDESVTLEILDDNPLLFTTVQSSPVSKVENSVFAIAPAAHLIIFCTMPSLNNLPDYNSILLSLAFLTALTIGHSKNF